jgi:hypothetical protein
MFWLVVQNLFDLYMNCTYHKYCWEMEYFTIWGQNMTTWVYILMVAGHIWTDKSDP